VSPSRWSATPGWRSPAARAASLGVRMRRERATAPSPAAATAARSSSAATNTCVCSVVAAAVGGGTAASSQGSALRAADTLCRTRTPVRAVALLFIEFVVWAAPQQRLFHIHLRVCCNAAAGCHAALVVRHGLLASCVCCAAPGACRGGTAVPMRNAAVCHSVWWCVQHRGHIGTCVSRCV
jgi:hypothetical protein